MFLQTNMEGVTRDDHDHGPMLCAFGAHAEERRARVPDRERTAEVDLLVAERALVHALVSVAAHALELGVCHDSLGVASVDAVLGGSNATPGASVAVARTFS